MLKWLTIISYITSTYAVLLLPTIFAIFAGAHHSQSATSHQQQESLQSDALWNSNITEDLFLELKELAQIADISYCVGTSGISKPFVCDSNCGDFPKFELVDTFHSSHFKKSICGYIVLDHGLDENGRILVVFRGTHSIIDVITDLMAAPQKYVPYPSRPENENTESKSEVLSRPLHDTSQYSFLSLIPRFFQRRNQDGRSQKKYYTLKCLNCTVHTGFWQSYRMIRDVILPQISSLQQKFPNYRIDLVGHSLGGAVAALAALELDTLGYQPFVTTFGQPRIGNHGLRDYIDVTFNLRSKNSDSRTDLPSSKSRYRRVTHISDIVPLLPPQKFGYRSHAGEIFISKKETPPSIHDVRLCFGDEDLNCIAIKRSDEALNQLSRILDTKEDIKNLTSIDIERELKKKVETRILTPKILQLYFAHLDYFSRMKLCLPHKDQVDWRKDEI